jgi:lambda family phage portal protein
MNAPALIDQYGAPLPRARAVAERGRMLAAGFRGASWSDPDLAGWTPNLYSAHAAYAPDRLALAARVKDLARNDGWLSSGVGKIVDAVIGSNWMLFSTPNYVSLGIDPDAAADLALQIESAWTDYATDHNHWIDAGRRLTFGGLLALSFRHRCYDGEALGQILYEKRPGADYDTFVHIVDPDRLSNPYNQIDTVTRRMGVELGPREEPVGYWIRAAHPGDAGVYNPNLWKWDYSRRETSWGRRLTFHAFEPERAGQFRGQSALNALIKKIKQLGRYDEAELQAALLNAIMAAFIESPFDHDQIAEMMNGDDQLSPYNASRLEWYEKMPIKLGGAQVGFLHPGEKVELTRPNHPNSVFENYVAAGLRNMASVLGLSYEQFSADWSKVNYSSARAAIIEVWRGFSARREFFADQVAQPIYAGWLEEAIDKGRVKLPPGAPDFQDRMAAYCCCDWIGPARGWVDPMKEAEASVVRMSAGLSTLQRECAEQGSDYRKIIVQRAREKKEMTDAGLDPTEVAALAGKVKGNIGDEKPGAEQKDAQQ